MPHATSSELPARVREILPRHARYRRDREELADRVGGSRIARSEVA